MKSSVLKSQLVFIGLAMVINSVANAAADPEVDQYLKLANKNLMARSEQSTLVLKTRERNGDILMRKLTYKSSRDLDSRSGPGAYKALGRILSPADAKGTSIYAEVKGSEQNQWLYLPSSHQVRRVVTGKKAVGVLGSELSTDDFNPTSIRGSQVRVVERSNNLVKLEIVPKSGMYSKVLLTLSRDQGLPQKMEYYVGNRAQKTVDFNDYFQPDGKIYRPRKISVHNLMNGRSTEAEFSNMVVSQSKGSGISVADLRSAD